MEGKANVIKESVLPIVKTVVAVAVVTVVMLLILSFLLYKFKFTDNMLLTGIGVIYFISNFVGGMIIGKVKGQKRFIWGFAVGVTYFVVLALVSVLMTRELFQNGVPIVIAFACCALGGTLGGMVS